MSGKQSVVEEICALFDEEIAKMVRYSEICASKELEEIKQTVLARVQKLSDEFENQSKVLSKVTAEGVALIERFAEIRKHLEDDLVNVVRDIDQEQQHRVDNPQIEPRNSEDAEQFSKGREYQIHRILKKLEGLVGET